MFLHIFCSDEAFKFVLSIEEQCTLSLPFTCHQEEVEVFLFCCSEDT